MRDRLSVAKSLREIGALLRLRGGKPFRARAYEKAAASIEALGDGVFFSLVEEGRLAEVPRIGAALAEQITELARGGDSRMLSDLRVEFPQAIVALASVPGISLERARRLHEELGISSLDELAEACRAARVREVSGFGPATERKLAAAIERYRERAKAIVYPEARAATAALEQYLAPGPTFVAGSVRRGVETTDEVTVVVASDDAPATLDRAARYPLAAYVDFRESERVAARLTSGVRAIVWAVPECRVPRALLEATGPDDYVRALVDRARVRGIDLDRDEFDSEDAIFRALGLAPTPPELRDHPAAIAMAERGELRLVEADDIRGLIHCHTTYSDGRDDIEAMAHAADELGMEYMTITDHSPEAHYAGGVEVDRLKRQWDEIAEVQTKVKVQLLRGTESDILRDGALDYPNEILDRLDVVIASVHNRMHLSPEEMTRRLVAAMRVPQFKIWGHPLGRLLLRRQPIACDVEAVLDAAAESRAAIEINGDPYRLDLEPRWIRAAKERGLSFVVSTDAHSTNGLRAYRYGVTMARRGGLSPADVLNTFPAETFRRAVKPAA